LNRAPGDGSVLAQMPEAAAILLTGSRARACLIHLILQSGRLPDSLPLLISIGKSCTAVALKIAGEVMVRSWRLQLAGFAGACTLLCGIASAQVDPAALERANRVQQLQQFELDNRLEANSAIPPSQRAMIDYGGYFSPQYFSIDDSAHNNHSLREYDLVGYLRADFDGANEVFVRGRTSYDDYSKGDSFDGFGSRLINPDVDRAYYKFDLARYEAAYNGKQINGDFMFEGGRDLVYWGNGLVLGQTLDGVMPSASVGPISVTGVAGVTPTRTVDIQPDRPEFSFDTRRGFYGALLSVTVAQQHPYVYGLIQRDYNGDHDTSLNGPITTRYSYNSDYLGVGSTGPITDHFRYGIESAVELGNTLSDSSTISGQVLVPVNQTRDYIKAYATDAKLDYVPQDQHNSRFSLEGIAASGDRDRGLTNTTFNGNKPNTPDRAFSAFGLLNTGLAFAAPPSNLLVLRAGASTFPLRDRALFKRLQVGTDLFVFGRPDSSAPIDESTVKGPSYLGWEPDIYANWQLESDVTIALRYGVFVPNPSAYTDSVSRQFLYLGATFAF
jgi:hypothetical protein